MSQMQQIKIQFVLNHHTVLLFLLWVTFVQFSFQATYQTPTSILNTSQYHFIPNGSYLQYTFTSANLQIDNANDQNDTFS